MSSESGDREDFQPDHYSEGKIAEVRDDVITYTSGVKSSSKAEKDEKRCQHTHHFGYTCSRKNEHSGNHHAHTRTGKVVAEWKNYGDSE